jgi:integration host factor subunit beta
LEAVNDTAITRARLAAEVSDSTGITRREADLIVETVFDAIAGALRSGEEVEIRGFGSFRLRSRKARLTRNPRTGEQIMVPPKRVPFFRAGKALRDRLNRETNGESLGTP